MERDTEPNSSQLKIMLTGHRDLTEEETSSVESILLKIIQKAQISKWPEIISGMAIGADTIWAEVARKTSTPLAAYIPFLVQPNKWPEEQKEIWRSLREYAHRERIFGEEYSNKFFHARNHGMVDDADLCIAVLRPSVQRGGTYQCVKYIRKKNKPLILIDLDSRKITTENYKLSKLSEG